MRQNTDMTCKEMEERIRDLVKSNDLLQREVDDLKSQVALAREEQKQSRTKALQFQDDFQTLEVYNQKLRDKLQEWIRTLTYLRNTIMRSGEDCLATLAEELQVFTMPLQASSLSEVL